MGHSLLSINEVVEEITRIHRSLPSRPSIDGVEAAMALVRNVDKEEQSRIDAILTQGKGLEVPEELFSVLQEMYKNLVCLQSREQKREALKLLDLESVHALFDEMIQRASRCLPANSNGSVLSIPDNPAAVSAAAANCMKNFNSNTVSSVHFLEGEVGRSSERITRDDSYVKKARPTMHETRIGADLTMSREALLNSSMKPDSTSGEGNQKLSLINLASLIEASSKKGTRDLNLRNKLMDQMDWLPDSIGKLSALFTLDLSENRIVALPTTIGALSSLTKLDLHSNFIAELPDSAGDLSSLLYLDVSGNQLMTLPPSFGKLVHLVELDLTANRISSLPDAIGNLTSLKKLDLEANNIEEFPYTIGHCVSLVELRADYNRLKCLPEALGRIESLEVLSVRYNNIKGLPTTMATLSKLKEIDVSFNELELIPEGLCLATSLVKLNVGNNFADLQHLPRSIGNLEMLEELDISNNQIRVLPDSFGRLSRLHVLHAEENPLEVPPRHITEMDAQAAVHYMAEIVAKRDVKLQPIKPQLVKTMNTWSHICFFSGPNKRKHYGQDSMILYIKSWLRK